MGKLFLFSLLVFSSLNAFANTTSISIYIGDQGDKKVSCKPLDRQYYFCKDGDRELYVRHQRSFQFSPLTGVEVIGDEVRFLDFEKFEIDGELKEFASDSFPARPKLGYKHKEVEVGNRGINDKISNAHYVKSSILGIEENVPESLSDLYHKVNNNLEEMISNLESSEATIDINGKSYTCPADNILAENCHVSLCSGSGREKVYFVRSFNDPEPAKFYQFSVNENGELNGIDPVVDMNFSGFNLPFYPPVPNFGTGASPWSTTPGQNESIITEEMRVPKEYSQNSEQFYELTDSFDIHNLKYTLRQCPEKNPKYF